jgi:hypothetical protein
VGKKIESEAAKLTLQTKKDYNVYSEEPGTNSKS